LPESETYLLNEINPEDTPAALDAQEAAIKAKYFDPLAATKTANDRYQQRLSDLQGANEKAGLSQFFGAFKSMGQKFVDAYNKEAADEFNKMADQGQKLYESTRTPLEKHANAMSNLDDLLENKAITPDLYARRKFQLDQEYEKETGFDETVNRKPSQFGGVENIEAFQRQLQDAVLANHDPATGTKQDKANTHLENIDDNIKAAAAAEFMFA
jgi:hypothetical protein